MVARWICLKQREELAAQVRRAKALISRANFCVIPGTVYPLDHWNQNLDKNDEQVKLSQSFSQQVACLVLIMPGKRQRKLPMAHGTARAEASP